MVQRRRTQPKRSSWLSRLQRASPRVLKLGMVGAALLMVLGGVLSVRAMLNNPENMPISQINIQGGMKYIKDVDLRAVVEKYTKTNLYLLDVDALETDLEAQPWVRGISLRTVWPSQLIVEVEEQHPIAFWGDDRLMNQFGEIFTAKLPTMKGVLPRLYSPDENGHAMGERYVQVLGWLRGLPLEIAELTEDEHGMWNMKLRNGPLVLIGNKDQERRIQRFRVGFQQELANKLGNIRQIDLRYTNGFAVEWKQPPPPVGLLDITGGSRRS